MEASKQICVDESVEGIKYCENLITPYNFIPLTVK